VKPSPCSDRTPQGVRARLPRHQQLSVKITDEACERFRRLARAHGLTLGDLFEQALDAWETQRGAERGLDAAGWPRR
jgi:hypothetical protein